MQKTRSRKLKNSKMVKKSNRIEENCQLRGE